LTFRRGLQRVSHHASDGECPAATSENPPPGTSHQEHRNPKVTREALAGAYRELLAGDVGQVAGALYSYGRRLVDERRAQRGAAPSGSGETLEATTRVDRS
jgi:hypothetical protein